MSQKRRRADRPAVIERKRYENAVRRRWIEYSAKLDERARQPAGTPCVLCAWERERTGMAVGEVCLVCTEEGAP